MNRIATFIIAALAAAVPAIVDSALKGAVLLALVALVVALMRQASAAARHLAWFLGVVGLLLLPLLSAALPGWRVLPRWASFSSQSTVITRPESEHRSTTAPIARQPSLAFAGAAALVHPGVDLPASPANFSRANPGPWFTGLWLAVAVLLLLRVIVSILSLRLSARRAASVTNGPLWEALQSACEQLRIRKHVRLLLDERRTVPFVWGTLRPRLVLPAEARTWGESRLRVVLLHELAHVKRLDLLVLLLTQIACALHWFNPLVWLAAWQMHLERERACDNLVLNAGVKASDYAEHLLQVATTLETDRPAVALAMARPSRLEGRLLAVLSEHVKRSEVTRAIAFLAVAVGLGIIIPIGMLRADDNAGVQPVAPNNSAAVEPARDTDVNPAASPKENRSAASQASNADVLTVKADGSMMMNATPVSREQLAKQLADWARLNPGHAIVVRADQNVPYEHVVRALEVCRGAGIKIVSARAASDFDKEITDLTNELEKLPKGEPKLLTPPEQYGRWLAELEDRVRELRRRFPNAPASETENLLSRAGKKDAANGTPSERTESAPPESDFAREQLNAADRELKEQNKSQRQLANQEAARARLRRAEAQLERAKALYEQKLFSEHELAMAQAEVELHRAEVADDPTAVAQVRVRKAEADLDRASKLFREKLISPQEVDSLKYNVEIARAELAQANSSARKIASDREAKAEILQLLDEEIRLAEEKLALLKQQHAAGTTTPSQAIRMQAELLALRRTKAAQEGKQSEVERLFDEQIKVLEDLEASHRATPNFEYQRDSVLTALDIRREILALKRQKAGMGAVPAGTRN